LTKRSLIAGRALALCLGAAACSSPAPSSDTADAAAAPARASSDAGGEFRGLEFVDPIEMPAFTFTDTSGEPYDFLAETAGKLSFLFFGFTHCPDVCPVQMANLAAALGDLGYADRRQIEVVFITTDPERDTPAVLDEYLDRFDHEFVGLTAPSAEVNALLAALDLPPSVKEPIEGTDDYMVGHVAQIMATTGDGRIRLAYPGGVRQNDWRADLPALLSLNASVTSGGGD
jgi:protein SCO1/2